MEIKKSTLETELFLNLSRIFPYEIWDVRVYDGYNDDLNTSWFEIRGVHKGKGKLSRECKDYVNRLTTFMEKELGLKHLGNCLGDMNYINCNYGPIPKERYGEMMNLLKEKGKTCTI